MSVGPLPAGTRTVTRSSPFERTRAFRSPNRTSSASHSACDEHWPIPYPVRCTSSPPWARPTSGSAVTAGAASRTVRSLVVRTSPLSRNDLHRVASRLMERDGRPASESGNQRYTGASRLQSDADRLPLGLHGRELIVRAAGPSISSQHRDSNGARSDGIPRAEIDVRFSTRGGGKRAEHETREQCPHLEHARKRPDHRARSD